MWRKAQPALPAERTAAPHCDNRRCLKLVLLLWQLMLPCSFDPARYSPSASHPPLPSNECSPRTSLATKHTLGG